MKSVNANMTKAQLIEAIVDRDEKITELMMTATVKADQWDNEFHREAAVVTFHANKPAAFKASWGTPRIAEIELGIHTGNGTFYIKDIEILKLESRPMVAVPSRSYEKDGKKVYRDYVSGRAVKNTILAKLGQAIKAGFKLLGRGRDPETQSAFDALMGSTTASKANHTTNEAPLTNQDVASVLPK